MREVYFAILALISLKNNLSGPLIRIKTIREKIPAYLKRLDGNILRRSNSIQYKRLR
jgi:hypothetical protein